jgi:hypothetical protein
VDSAGDGSVCEEPGKNAGENLDPVKMVAQLVIPSLRGISA